MVGVLLDTFRDHHRAYVFYSNPLGIQSDSIYTEGQTYDYSFDTLWNTEGRLTPDGYIVFFSIPFKSLRFSHAPQQTWGVALYRVILRKSEYDYWPYLTQRVEGLTQQFEPVGGLENVSPGRNMQFIPYGLLAGDHFLNQPVLNSVGPPPSFQNAFEHRAGLDANSSPKTRSPSTSRSIPISARSKPTIRKSPSTSVSPFSSPKNVLSSSRTAASSRLRSAFSSHAKSGILNSARA
jgi:hypothetical protein